jgi:hypothetical protein
MRSNSNPFVIASEVLLARPRKECGESNHELKITNKSDNNSLMILSRNNTDDDTTQKSPPINAKDMYSQDGLSSHGNLIEKFPRMKRQHSEYEPRLGSERKDRQVRRSLGGGPVLPKNHLLNFVIDTANY